MRELFIDRDKLGTFSGAVRLRLHQPHAHAADSSFPKGAYQTLLVCDDEIRLYYRGIIAGYQGELFSGHPGEFTGVAVLRPEDQEWQYPKLNLFAEAPANTVLFACPETHNFTPFIDRNPNCPKDERFKAVAGITPGNGLYVYHSADGFNWHKYTENPVIGINPAMVFSFDSQNIAFYSESEGKYLLYYRVRTTSTGERLRAIARAESKDFLHWTDHSLIDMNRPDEHLYVSLLTPYPRVPGLLIGTPTRFFKERSNATDIILIFSPDGKKILRPFPEAWIRPGIDPERWENRANYLAWNILTGINGELNFFHSQSQVRYSLRADGFTSLSTGVEAGEWRSRPLIASGEDISFNVATSAGGDFSAALFDASGQEIPGFGFSDCEIFYGDNLELLPCWRGGPPCLAPGTVFSLGARFCEADLYSFTY